MAGFRDLKVGIPTPAGWIVGILAEHRWKHLVQIG